MTYVRNAWYVAGWSQDLPAAQPQAITILNEPIVLWRDSAGQAHAFEDRCVHRLAALSLGRCEGDHLRCMYHGMLYAADGKVVEIPGQELVPPKARVKAYPLVERHDWLWLWPGDPALADPALIPPAVGPSEPDWVLGTGFLDYAAEARLICDNLCDFAHLSYVHAQSFGASETWARSRPKVTASDRGVRFERWIEGEVRMAGGTEQPVDHWSAYDFLLPGILLMEGATFPAGTAKRFDNGAPDVTLAVSRTYTSQAVTPLTDKTARYFFSWGPHRSTGDEAMRDMLMGIAAQAFAEDKAMIEAQQKIIDATPNPAIMPTSSDKGAVLYNRLVERLVRHESDCSNPAAKDAA
jgi:vanillate O-demethylase monooxygenase subunit